MFLRFASFTRQARKASSTRVSRPDSNAIGTAFFAFPAGRRVAEVALASALLGLFLRFREGDGFVVSFMMKGTGAFFSMILPVAVRLTKR